LRLTEVFALPAMKRKQASNAAASATVRPAKKVKGDALPWKSIDFGPDIEGANMLLGFEEVDGVTVEYSQDGLKTANFLVKDMGSPTEPPSDTEEAEWVPLSTESDAEEAAPEASTSSSKLGSIDNSPFQSQSRPVWFVCPGPNMCSRELAARLHAPSPVPGPAEIIAQIAVQGPYTHSAGRVESGSSGRDFRGDSGHHWRGRNGQPYFFAL
jgi:hypothetical protein